MKMTITESDKKILSYLTAFLIVILVGFFVFRPLLSKTENMRRELAAARVEVKSAERKMTQVGEIKEQETQMTEHSKETLARFYPMMPSQDVEKMVTTLMLNHNLQIQSLNISMPEIPNEPAWYLHAENAVQEEEEERLPLYAARIICVAEGNDRELWQFIDDISNHYPAISIAGAEFSLEQLTLELEIYMCNQ